MTRIADMPVALARAYRAIPDERAAAEPEVLAASRTRDDRERARVVAHAEVQREVQLAARVDAAIMAARLRIEQLEGGLPSIAARVIVGDVGVEAEDEVLLQIADARRELQRSELARPVIAARANAPRARHDQIARQVAELDERLQEAVHEARERLARADLGID